MENFKLIVVFYLKIISCIYCSDVINVQEDSFIELSCPDVRRDSFPVTLNLISADGFTSIAASFSENSCVKYFYECQNKVHTYTVWVPVSQTSRQYTGYFCFPNETFSIQFYAVPQNVSCTGPVIDEENNRISISCSTAKVFPDLSCIFSFFSNGSMVQLNGTTNYSITVTSDDPNYYSIECKHEFPITDLVAVDNTFSVAVFPRITDGILYGENKTLTHSFVLSIPEASFDDSCYNGPNVSQGYIKSGTTATCTCRRRDNGTFGNIYLFDESSHLIAAGDKKDKTIIITYGSYDNNILICKGISVLGNQSDASTFKQTTADGPTTVNISLDKSTLDLCYESKRTATLVCSVPRPSANPGVIFTFLENGTERKQMTVNSTSVSEDYSADYELNPLESGRVNLTCVARNVIFQEIFASQTVFVEVASPATPKLNLVITKENLVFKRVEMSCDVDHKTASTDTFITCPDTQPTKLTLASESNLTVSTELNAQLCNCTVYVKNICHVINQTFYISINIPDFAQVNEKGAEKETYLIVLIVVSVVAGVLVILLVVVSIWCLKRFFRRRRREEINNFPVQCLKRIVIKGQIMHDNNTETLKRVHEGNRYSDFPHSRQRNGENEIYSIYDPVQPGTQV